MTKLKGAAVGTGKTMLPAVRLKRPETGKSRNDAREPRLTGLRGSAAQEHSLPQNVIEGWRQKRSCLQGSLSAGGRNSKNNLKIMSRTASRKKRKK